MIFSNITVPLLGLVDTAVIGHLDSPIHRGVAIGAVATSFLFMLLLFLRMSTTTGGAGAGAQNPQALARAFMQPLPLALLAGERSSCCAIR